jgi:acyl-coenzyme A synthetase/AMP-(fatty) acid ligase
VLVRHRDDYDAAVAAFHWPDVGDRFNWALDWFDPIAAGNPRTALRIIDEDGSDRSYSFVEMSERSDRLAASLAAAGVARGDRVMVMLGNQVELWESMLAVMKLGAVIMPAATALGFLGLRPGDVHLNISSPGWAKHAWSSFFAPWIAESAIVVYNYARFDADHFLTMLRHADVTSLCAPPTVWRMLIQADLGPAPAALRETVGAGEPLNPEVIAHVQKCWGLSIRGGFGQTETTALIGNAPHSPVKPGSMGRPLAGVAVEIVDPVSGQPADEGEICLRLDPRPVNLMTRYLGDDDRNDEVTAAGYYHTGYHTGDVASRDVDGFITYIGRTDDVFKASDYKISHSNWKVCSSSIRRWPRQRWCRPPTQPGWPYPRLMSAWRRGGSPIRPPPTPSSPMRASTSRPTNAFSGSSSWSYPRRSPARFGVSTCGLAKMHVRQAIWQVNIATGCPSDAPGEPDR